MKNQLWRMVTPFVPASRAGSLFITGLWIGIFAVMWLMAPILLPSPIETSLQLWAFISDPDFYSDVFATIFLTLTGMFFSIILASLIAYLSVISLFRPMSYFIVKIRYMSMAGFMFAFTILLGGKADEVKIAMLILGITPFFTLTLLGVIEKIDQKEYDLWTTLRYNRWEQLWHVIIRGKSDLLLEAVRTNNAIAWGMIIMIETYSMANGGVGVLLYKAAGKTQIDKVFALQFGIILLIGIGIDYGLRQLRYAIYPHIKLAEKQ